MIKKVDHSKMGRSELGWLNSWFHFSFAEYYNPDNIKYGALRVINDDIIQPHTGFDTHPHKDMEIITYVADGELTHGDSMDNKRTLARGDVQYMSAGTGIFHSELNESEERLRLLQIWILPDAADYIPQYGDYHFPWSDRLNQWAQIVSPENGTAPIRIHQDMNIFVTQLIQNKSLEYEILPGRQAYLVLIEGRVQLNEVTLEKRDAAEITAGKLKIQAQSEAHLIFFEMKEPEMEKD